jgi:pimeloyl-ACP methyl ester carboxylesterase
MTVPKANRYGRRQRNVKSTEVEGLSIAYERAGDGPPLVLLHGYVGDGLATWRHQIEHLSTDFTVVAWDAPGAGKSADPPETFGIAGYAECLAQFIEGLGLGPSHVMGLSFGGALALAFQRLHPELVRSLVLASAYAGWRGSLPADVAEARLTQALQLSTRSGQEFVDTLLPTMFALPIPPEDLEAFRTAMKEFHPSGFRAMARASVEDLSDVLPGVGIPTLLVYGANDPRAPLTIAQHLHGAIGGSQLVVLEGAGHVCNIELPQQFNAVVGDFLDDATRSPGPT